MLFFAPGKEARNKCPSFFTENVKNPPSNPNPSLKRLSSGVSLGILGGKFYPDRKFRIDRKGRLTFQVVS